MNRRIALAAALLPLAGLAACEDGEPAAPVRPVQVENPYHEGLIALSEPMQRLGLMRAIRDSGNRCKRVDAGGYQQDYRGMKMWVARCSDSGEWAVFIAPSGDIQVRPCDQAAQLELPQCRIPEGAAAEPAPAG